VLVHCNSYLDGLWTDITRTFCLGPTNKRFADLTKTLLQSRDAALGAIRPAALGRDVDACARKVLEKARLGKMFKHGTGHGVGFAAIDHLARPRIHPASDDVLEEGMVFNIEPAVYFENEFGLRHCDMVRVTQTGVELLTPFQGALEGLTVG
jgi:Xaa-Pro aminopeptidase